MKEVAWVGEQFLFRDMSCDVLSTISDAVGWLGSNGHGSSIVRTYP